MSIILKFRMLSDENDNFLRDYEVPYDMNLLEFHKYLLETLEYEDCVASFFVADPMWEKGQEFTVVDMEDHSEGAPLPMETSSLGQIMHKHKDRLIYLFDLFGDRAYYFEVTGASEIEEGIFYPRETYGQADVPNQYEASLVDGDDGSAFEDMMGDFSEFEGGDDYDDQY